MQFKQFTHDTRISTKVCNTCNEVLTEGNWAKSRRLKNTKLCNSCKSVINAKTNPKNNPKNPNNNYTNLNNPNDPNDPNDPNNQVTGIVPSVKM